MSTESGKTCGCTVTHFFATTSGKYEIAYCPLHSGERIAELTRENHELALACEARDDERIKAQNRVVDLEREIEILRGREAK